MKIKRIIEEKLDNKEFAKSLGATKMKIDKNENVYLDDEGKEVYRTGKVENSSSTYMKIKFF